MDLKLNAEQRAAVAMVLRASKTPLFIGVLAGPAGTGKTTTLKAALEGVKARVVAPTGKAALRAQAATGQPAMTIHRLMYRVLEGKTDDDVTFIKRTPPEVAAALDELPAPPTDGRTDFHINQRGRGPRLLIIDEASMISQDMWEHITEIAKGAELSVVLVGDNYQLPPVQRNKGKEFNVFDPTTLTRHETVELTQVFRQALDSPILRVATLIRTEKRWGAALIAMRQQLPQVPGNELVKLAAELRRQKSDAVIITYTNPVRLRLNNEIRAELGFGPVLIQKGEPLLVRRNSYKIGVMNGEVIEFEGFVYEEGEVEPESITVQEETFMFTHVRGVRCALHMAAVMGDVESVPSNDIISEMQVIDLARHPPPEGMPTPEPIPVLRANLGYVVTCHSAQGSEWDRVVVVIQQNKVKYMSDDHRCRWGYTAVTRGKTQTDVCFYS